ncbi:hypothetical protein TRICHSKD4_2366 [Roseibium sp. TrichSKD4]|uniref:hypothetical protein n=1 Tax=Roseibium sp. TrichSKD4 TaxID=744980 RepID=UPI0001E56AEC|nr:hypothetical protein [Roseibium sp. TrichSKD4]EFO32564.1 hypothetical protein TRICHSKD4_2366 [Roseibium sp. TrichSKD4]
MSDKNDTKFQKQDANFKRQGLDGTAKIEARFNQDAKLGADIAKASPEAQKTVNDLLKLEESRLQTETRNQERSHEFRVLKEKDRLMQDYFSSPQPIPSDPQAKQVVYDEISNSAERMVSEREQYYRDQITRQTDQNIREVVKMDQQGIVPSHDQSHDQEHGGR